MNTMLQAVGVSRICLALGLSFFASNGLAQTISFKTNVLPLLQRHCVACHLTGEEQGGLGLTPKLAYNSLVGKASGQSGLLRVAPGEPERSYILHKLRGSHLDQGGSGARMPQGLEPLGPEDMGQLLAWIQAGAPNN
jgi:cytochrome c553